MKKTYLIPLILLGSICLAVVAAQTQPRHDRQDRPKHHDRPGPHGAERFEALDLSETQQEQIKTIHRETAKKKAQKKADIRIAHIDLEALMDEGQTDRKKIHTQIKKIATLRADMKILQVDQRLDIQKLLNPEQRERFKKMGKHRRHMRRQQDQDHRPHE